MTPAHNAKILTTGIAIASTFGISTAYAIQANAKILEKIEAAQITVLTDPALVATTEVTAPSTPGAAVPATTKIKTGTTAIQVTTGVAPVTTDGATTSTGMPVTPTNVPAANSPVTITPPAAPAATNPPATIAPTPTTAPATSASK